MLRDVSKCVAICMHKRNHVTARRWPYLHTHKLLNTATPTRLIPTEKLAATHNFSRHYQFDLIAATVASRRLELGYKSFSSVRVIRDS